MLLTLFGIDSQSFGVEEESVCPCPPSVAIASSGLLHCVPTSTLDTSLCKHQTMYSIKKHCNCSTNSNVIVCKHLKQPCLTKRLVVQLLKPWMVFMQYILAA